MTQKVTELGAQAIWGFPADSSVVKWDGKKLAKKEDKLSKMVLGDAAQSKSICVPEVRVCENNGEFVLV
ncbi:16S rRNA (uracil(1498)-N(3))-methyltransferase [Klebsiella pneumoniae subsp. pneumoniae]|nr:16S rRNA (uracil(1498)-N(3))-methyltransferase [Klebsiella pneumoniae subsp. pneumoniae]